MLKKIYVDNTEVALVIEKIKTEERVKFYTDPDDQLQIGAFNMQKGQKIPPHSHLKNRRELYNTAEVLYVRKGVLTVLFYKEDKSFDQKINLSAGDIILLKKGSHGFEIQKDCEFIEIKQGPYLNDKDKVRF